MSSSPIRVLVTGGAGFIGSHVVPVLLARGMEVTVLDSLISGTRENVPEGAAFIEADVRDRAELARAMQGMTHVLHLAALVSVAGSMEDPLATHDVNVTGTQNVFDAAREAKVVRAVYASSAAVYGDEPSLPKKEDSVLKPLSPYALSKVEGEAIASLYAEAFGVSSIGLRFFNVYGPGQKGNHPYASVIPRFLEAIKEGRSIDLYGDGSQTRDFIHVNDVARALFLALGAEEAGAAVYNVASGKELSLKDLIILIEEVTGKAVQVAEHKERAGDIRKSVADVTNAHTHLGFSAEKSIREGVQELFV